MTPMTPSAHALAFARGALGSDGFVDGHVGLKPDQQEPGTVSVHLNGAVADALLLTRGWVRTGVAWVAPDGEYCWHRDEALTLALTAEAVR